MMFWLLVLCVFLCLASSGLVEFAQKGDIQSLVAKYEESLQNGQPLDLNVQDADSLRTPLMEASIWGHENIVSWLLEHGADASIPEKDGYTPPHGAAFQGHVQVAEALLKHGIDLNKPHSDGFTPVFRSTWGKKKRYEDAVRFFLDSVGVSANSQEPKSGMTLLISAGKSMNEEVVRILLEKGADVNAQDKEGNTVLHYVAKSVDITRARKLVPMIAEYSPDLTIVNKLGKSAKDYAVENRFSDANLVEILSAQLRIKDEL